ncbi:MAG: head-tail connector protein [Oscillospiraceae bacterium]|nr:head-tail connector protein [Oscillospiraceae bacterium]
MKVSEIDTDTIKDYCGISDDDSDHIIELLKDAARAFIRNYTALSDIEIDNCEDLCTAYMVLINDMYTNREYNSSQQRKSTMLNPCVKTILDMHSFNNVGWTNE